MDFTAGALVGPLQPSSLPEEEARRPISLIGLVEDVPQVEAQDLLSGDCAVVTKGLPPREVLPPPTLPNKSLPPPTTSTLIGGRLSLFYDTWLALDLSPWYHRILLVGLGFSFIRHPPLTPVPHPVHLPQNPIK